MHETFQEEESDPWFR